MAIDRIIAGIILIPGVIHIAMLYATAGDPPFHAPAPALWVAIALGIIYTIESATILRRRTQPVRMLWICIILELIRLTVLIVGGPLRLPSFSGHPICTDLVSVGEDVHCESTAQEVHAGVPA